MPDQREQSYEIESLQNSHQNGHGHIKRKPRTTSVRVPSVNVISEIVADGQMIRSQSVGHSMAVVATNNYDSNKLLNINYCNGRQENGIKTTQNNGKPDGMRYTLSQPLLLVNSTTDSEHENKPLKDSHKHWRSGTLSRPDIFYQASTDKFTIKIKSILNIQNSKKEGKKKRRKRAHRIVAFFNLQTLHVKYISNALKCADSSRSIVN